MTAIITIAQYCSLYNIDPSFIISLKEEGLIDINEEGIIEEENLYELETYTRWYHEMGINTAGIDVIKNLLQKQKELREEILELRKRLRLYENDDSFLS